MLSVKSCPLPQQALLGEYARRGAYTDCYQTEISGLVTHAQYVNAFYTTLVFRLERLILKWALSKPSSDDDARRLADGASDRFAAWTVENRSENQLLLCDFQGRTRSWLMLAANGGEDDNVTRLYFGSAIVPAGKVASANKSPTIGFGLLLGFHRIYSVVLLYSARSRLEKLKLG